MKKVLVLGASGATGRLLTKQLLSNGFEVVAIVRAASSLNKQLLKHENLQVLEANVSELSVAKLRPYLAGCKTVFSCLGHNMNFKGIFGQPRLLVRDAIRTVVQTLEALGADKTVKLILMNTSGNSNRDIPEQPPLSQRAVIAILRFLLPPHRDNEKASDYLRCEVGPEHRLIQWVVVRPDTLIDESFVSVYSIYPSPIQNVIFNAALTSRVNVANFMVRLAMDSELWNVWQGKMPVVYNHPV